MGRRGRNKSAPTICRVAGQTNTAAARAARAAIRGNAVHRQLVLSLPAAERAELEARAKELGVTPQRYLRDLARADLERERELKAKRRLELATRPGLVMGKATDSTAP